jgi:hypothetical protein
LNFHFFHTRRRDRALGTEADEGPSAGRFVRQVAVVVACASVAAVTSCLASTMETHKRCDLSACLGPTLSFSEPCTASRADGGRWPLWDARSSPSASTAMPCTTQTQTQTHLAAAMPFVDPLQLEARRVTCSLTL